MKRLLAYLYYVIIRSGLSLRYRIKVKGAKTLTKEALSKPGGTLFLATHPAEIDPLILLRVFWPKFRLRPIAVEYLFRKPFVRYFLDFVRALAIPSFVGTSNSYKRRQVEKTYEKIFAALRGGENLLIYPTGSLRRSEIEVLGGASGVHTILQGMPDLNIVLVRTRGLWGSSFSRALTGKTPDLGRAFFASAKAVFRNFIFFAPRRHVEIECMPAPPDFPYRGDRLEVNRYLEEWFNAPGPEPINLVPYSRFTKTLPEITATSEEADISFASVSDETQRQVVEEIAALAKVPPEQITPEKHLAVDLGLDSLDLAQITVALKENFGVNNVQLSDLTTVGSVFAFAGGVRKGKEDELEEESALNLWDKEGMRPIGRYGVGQTIPEVFFNMCEKMNGFQACVDLMSGDVTFSRLRTGVLLLAESIRQMPGDKIGILMPASVVVNAVIVATMLAGKKPVMINWTLGARNLSHVVEQTGIKATVSSWSFLDRLDNVELGPLDDQIILLEELRRHFTLRDKLRATLRARKSTEQILKIFGVENIDPDSPAVILFTSGTESMPKGVPLSHTNLISNQKIAYEMVNIMPREVMLGVLPPFHSFGFSVTGLLPILSGLRVAYSPNPTDGRRIAQAIARWQVSLICMAPTFIRNLVRVAAPEQMRSVRLVVSGAERLDRDLVEKLRSLNPNIQVIEGYGITECSPILTINPPGVPSQGVGKPLCDIELRIVHPETHEPMPQGEAGLIIARGPSIFAGYLDPKLPSPFLELAGKKWYQTGDLGYLDQRGYLTLSGRLKRFVKIGGEMVSLTSIEEALVSQAPNSGWETDPDRPTFAVCAREEEGRKTEIHLFTTLDLALDDVNQALRAAGMSNLTRIRSAQKVPFIPLLGSGKIDYRRLATQLERKRKNESPRNR